ncbi:MAG: twin-arginine translocase TatA/TatE family subunit [Kiritimatiellae bacterium]|nr:twin-arginine translocase TatA/TatE family subunit [Kiritimatiellia bacterium]
MLYIPDIAFLTSSVGAGEWIMLFAVVLVVVGPRRLPEIARKLGRTMEMFRRAADEFKEQLMSMDQEIEKDISVYTTDAGIDGVEGDQASDETYQPSYDYDPGAYEHTSDYPGNEDMVAEWDAQQPSTTPESPASAAAPESETPESAACDSVRKVAAVDTPAPAPEEAAEAAHPPSAEEKS